MVEIDDNLELNAINVEKSLLQYNYFPKTHDYKEEMPAFFHTEKFTPDIAKKIALIPLSKERKRAGFDVMLYRRTRHPNIPRVMGIPHPKAYTHLVKTITEYWDNEIREKCYSQNSNLEFEIQPDYRMVIHSYDRIKVDGEIENIDSALDFGKSYKVQTDITNFFHSIYSHSLPWAIVGHGVAKKDKDEKLWYNQLDKAVRQCQRNETKGIQIGPATSSVLSEIILSRVDEKLREKYQFTRYIDDYTAFVDSKSDADDFLMDLTKELDSYVLNLNPKKTKIIELPTSQRERWVTELNLIIRMGIDQEEIPEFTIHKLRLLIERAIELSKEYPDGSVLKYAFTVVLEAGVKGNDSEAMLYLQDTLLRYAYYYPALVPLINRLFGKRNIFYSERGPRLYKLYQHSLAQNQSDNIVWCLTYLMRDFTIRKEEAETIIKACCLNGAPMVILMAYIFAKKTSNSFSCITEWAQKRIQEVKDGSLDRYDVDQYWLLFYQLYFDDVDSLPYVDSNDNKVFQVLKDNGVSFVDFNHEDIKTKPELIFGKLENKKVLPF